MGSFSCNSSHSVCLLAESASVSKEIFKLICSDETDDLELANISAVGLKIAKNCDPEITGSAIFCAISNAGLARFFTLGGTVDLFLTQK